MANASADITEASPALARGVLIGIARRARPRAPMEQIDAVDVAAGGGLEGDHKGAKFPRRGVTVLAREAWEAALAALSDLGGPVLLPWTARRANLLVEGVRLPAARTAILTIGPVRLEVTFETYPCRRMTEVHPGLLRALAPDWRGGITARVLDGGRIRIGDPVVVVSSPAPHRPRLPG